MQSANILFSKFIDDIIILGATGRKYSGSVEDVSYIVYRGQTPLSRNFPHDCCGDTSYLFAEYLRGKGVDTIWYSSHRGMGAMRGLW